MITVDIEGHFPSTDGNGFTTGDIGVRTATLIVLTLVDTDGTSTVADNQSPPNVYIAGTSRSNGVLCVRQFYCIAPVITTSIAWTVVGTGKKPWLSFQLFIHDSGSLTFDGQDGAHALAAGYSNPFHTGSVTPANISAVFVSGAGTDSTYILGMSEQTDFVTAGNNAASGGVCLGGGFAHKIATTGAADEAEWQGNVSTPNIAVSIMVFSEEDAFTDGDPGDLVTVELQDRDDNVRPFAQVDLCDEPDYYGGYKSPRLMALDPIVTGLSDQSGHVEHPTFGATLADPDNALREMVEDATQKYVWGNPLIVRTVEDEDRRAELPMRHEMIGTVQDFEPADGLLFRFTGSSWLRRKLARKTAPPEFWVPLLNRTKFPLLPAALLTKAAQLPYGNVSDEVPAIDVGDIPPDLYPRGPADPVWIAGLERHAWGGTFTAGLFYFWVSAIKDGIESRIMAPSTSFDFDPPASDGVQLVFRSAMLPDLYRIMWSDSASFHPIDNPLAGTFARYMDILPADYPEGNNPYGGPDPADAEKRFVPVDDIVGGNDYHALVSDGGGGTIDAAKGAVGVTYVGELTIGGITRSAFLICRGAIKLVVGVFVAGVRVTSTGSSTQIEVPFMDDYATTFGANYIDLDGVRYTIIFATAQIAADAVSGAKPITVNIQGYETVGDTSGALITSPVRIHQHFQRNFLAADAGDADTLWLATCPNQPGAAGVTMQDNASYDAADAALADRLGGGYEHAGIICAGGEPESALDASAGLCVDGDFDSGINRLGQTMVSVEPFEVPDDADVIVLTEMLHIVDRSFKAKTDQSRDFWNQIPFAHTRDYTGISESGWLWRGLSVDDASITNYKQERKSGEIQFRFLRANSLQAQNTILDVVKRKRTRWRHPKRFVQLSAPYKASAQVKLGSVLRLDHVEGTGASGWVGRDVRVTRIATDLNAMVRTFDCYDLQPIYDGLDDAVDPSQTPQGLRAATSLVQLQQQVQNAIIDSAALQAEINSLNARLSLLESGVLTVRTADPGTLTNETAWIFRDGGTPETFTLRIRRSGTTDELPLGSI